MNPAAVSVQAANTANGARLVAAKAATPFVELTGADLQALLDFQKTLPSSKGRKVLKPGEEEFVNSDGTVIDSPEWLVAQAGAVLPEAIAGGAGGAAGGAAGAGAAGAGAAGAAGAAAALPLVSPLAFLPAVALVPAWGDVNNRPTLAHNIDKTDAVRLKIEIVGEKENTTTNPNWKAADPDSNPTTFYFQLKEGERVGDANVLFLDGKRLSLISGNGRFGINKDTGLITRLIDTPQLVEQTLEVVVTDTALVSTAVTVVIEKNNVPNLDRTPAGEDSMLKLVIEGPNDGTINSPTWAASDSDNHTTYFYFQLKNGERADDMNVVVIDGKRLSLISNDGRFSIDKITGLVTANPVVLTTPQFNEQTLDVVVTDTELVSAPVAVVVDKNRAPELTRTPVVGEDAKLKLVIEGPNDGTINSPTWAASDADKHNTYFYFQLKAGERADDVNVEVIDGKRLSLISNDGRFSINKLTGLVTANPVVLTIPQFNEQTLDVVVTDTELVSAPVAVVVNKNHVPDLARTLAVGEDLKLTLFVSGPEDGKTSLIDWNATDTDAGHNKYFYFQLNDGERVGQNDVKVINGNRLSLISGDGRFTIDMSTGQITRTDLSVFAPQLADQNLNVVVTDTELVSNAVTVTIEQNFAPTLARFANNNQNLTIAINAVENQKTSAVQWISADINGDNVLNHKTFFYFKLADDERVGDDGVITVNGQRLSLMSADARFKIDTITGEITATGIDELVPAELCAQDMLSVVVTDTELVSNAVNLTIDRILPIFTSDLAGVDVANNPVSVNSDEYFADQFDINGIRIRTINDANENGNPGGVDLINFARITEIENIVFSKSLNDWNITVVDELVEVNNALDNEDEDEEQEEVGRITSVIVENQFGATEDFGATTEDFRIEYVRFAEQASFNGYVLNTSIIGQRLDETGVYKIQPGANGDHCQDLLISFDDKVDYLDGYTGNDLLFAYGFNDTLNGGAGFDLLVIGEEPVVINDDGINQVLATVVLDHLVDRKDNLVDEFDTVVNFNEHCIIQLGNLMITFENEDGVLNPPALGIIDRIEVSTLTTYLEAQTEESFYLITYSGVDADNPNGTDSNIWHFSGDVQNRVVDQVAHFVEFNFFDYRVTALPPALPVI